jgi:hypothetical protein
VAKSGPDARRVQYLFQSESWDECVAEIVVLKHVFRQSDPSISILAFFLLICYSKHHTHKTHHDHHPSPPPPLGIFLVAAFVDLLNELRMGVVSKETEKIMAAKKEEVKYNDEILPTELSVPRSSLCDTLHSLHFVAGRSQEGKIKIISE